jgi:hypothetical protein
VFTEPLPSNERRDTHTDTDCWEGFMKYAFEVGVGVMIYVSSFINIGSGIQKLIAPLHTDSMEIAYAYFIFSK